jgi:hypothetical protein
MAQLVAQIKLSESVEVGGGDTNNHLRLRVSLDVTRNVSFLTKQQPLTSHGAMGWNQLRGFHGFVPPRQVSMSFSAGA